MGLIDKDEFKNKIIISESTIFGKLIDFQSGKADMSETAKSIVESVREDIEVALNKTPVLMNCAEYAIAKDMLNRLAKKLEESILHGKDND